MEEQKTAFEWMVERYKHLRGQPVAPPSDESVTPAEVAADPNAPRVREAIERVYRGEPRTGYAVIFHNEKVFTRAKTIADIDESSRGDESPFLAHRRHVREHTQAFFPEAEHWAHAIKFEASKRIGLAYLDNDTAFLLVENGDGSWRSLPQVPPPPPPKSAEQIAREESIVAEQRKAREAEVKAAKVRRELAIKIVKDDWGLVFDIARKLELVDENGCRKL